MAREITRKLSCSTDLVSVEAIDEPGPGGANHRYRISHANIRNTPLALDFQNGGIKEVGANGVTHEMLIGVCIDRLEGFQAGEFACDENEDALRFLSLALAALNSRTQKRIARGVEGMMQV